MYMYMHAHARPCTCMYRKRPHKCLWTLMGSLTWNMTLLPGISVQLRKAFLSKLPVLQKLAGVALPGKKRDESRVLLPLLTSFLREQIQKLINWEGARGNNRQLIKLTTMARKKS